MEDAQANGTSTFNPTYANYLRDAPNITDTSSADQCGKAREYFGFDKTFPIDMKICKKVGEYQNSGDMEFLNDVVKNMPDLPKPLPLPPPKEEPPEELDLKEIKIQSHQIKTSTKTKLGSASERELFNCFVYYCIVTRSTVQEYVLNKCFINSSFFLFSHGSM